MYTRELNRLPSHRIPLRTAATQRSFFSHQELLCELLMRLPATENDMSPGHGVRFPKATIRGLDGWWANTPNSPCWQSLQPAPRVIL